jgi:lysophospholipase L1-like esterase
MRRSRFATIGSTLVAAIALTAFAAQPAAASPVNRPASGTARPAYYLSLGDSLAFGYSDANLAAWLAAGGSPMNVHDYFHGYTDDLAGWLGATAVNLSCPEETTSTMLGIGGVCPAASAGYGTWPYSGSQLSAATRFLKHYHWWQRGIITLSIGSDDVLPIAHACLGSLSCPALNSALKTMRSNLSTILNSLRRAAPLATIVVLAPYNPFGFDYPVSNVLAVEVDLSIAGVALAHLDPVANAFTPINVTDAGQHCSYVYFGCSGSTDIHPTVAGYALIAQAFQKVLP